jgi:glutaredoxin-related protein
MASKPYILFYSNKCPYSTEVLKQTTTPPLNANFLYVNIDNKSYNLPPFVDRVPLIFIKDTKEVVIDDNIMRFLMQIRPSSQPAATQQQNAQGGGDLESLSDMAKGISSSYSFMDDKNDKLTPMNFVYLNGGAAATAGGGDPSRVAMNDESRGNKIDSACFDAYKNQRDLDMANFFPRR